MLNGFLGLRLDAVVGGDHENDDVGHPGAPCSHGGERRVARRVDEADAAVVSVHGISANVLGDATRFAADHAGVANLVKQRRLAVIDMAHHSHHRRPVLPLAFNAQGLLEGLLHGVFMDELDLVAHHLDYRGGRILVDGLVDGRHQAQIHQRLDDFAGLDGHALGEFADGDHLGHFDFPGNELGGLELAALLLDLDRRMSPTDLPATTALRLQRQLPAPRSALAKSVPVGAVPILALDPFARLFRGLNLRLGFGCGDLRAKRFRANPTRRSARRLRLLQRLGGLLLLGPLLLLLAQPLSFLRLAFRRPTSLLFRLLALLFLIADALRFQLRRSGLANPWGSGLRSRFFRLDVGAPAHHLDLDLVASAALAHRLHGADRTALEADRAPRLQGGASAVAAP